MSVESAAEAKHITTHHITLERSSQTQRRGLYFLGFFSFLPHLKDRQQFKNKLSVPTPVLSLSLFMRLTPSNFHFATSLPAVVLPLLRLRRGNGGCVCLHERKGDRKSRSGTRSQASDESCCETSHNLIHLCPSSSRHLLLFSTPAPPSLLSPAALEQPTWDAVARCQERRERMLHIGSRIREA